MTSAPEQRSFLARRLTIAIATPIFVLVVLGILLGRQLLQMAEDADWVDHSDRVISTIYDTQLRIIDQETALRGYLLAGDAIFLEPFERARPLEGFDRLSSLVTDNPSQQTRFAEARHMYEAWLASATHAIQTEDVESARKAENMYARKSRMDAIRKSMRAALDVEEDLRNARNLAAESSTTATKQAFVGLLGGVALLLAFFSRRQLGSIASTFGAALDAQRSANLELEREAWVREGQAKVSAALQGEKTPVQVGADCLTTIAGHTRADIGAFFIKESGVWHRRAGIAVDSRAAAESFADGEGLVGRAAAEGRVLDVRDVPPDFLKLRSGTGETAPAHVVIVPACVEGRAHAVLELGFFRTADARVIDLLERIGGNVGLAVRSAEYKEMLRELLEETQRQREQLQTQQDQLQAQNEELERHTRALQAAHARMERTQSELEQINSQLEEQTQALARQRDDLSTSQSELRRANTYKSEFMANMSHELRTPLNSSLILAKLLTENRKGHLDSEEVQFAQTIYSAGNDLLTLINDILDLSKIEAGKLDVRAETIPVARVIEELSNTFRPIAKDKGLELAASIEDNVPQSIVTDSTRLQQILKNLLSNAFKFTERGGVTLTVRSAGSETIAFDVKDTGIGIPAEQHEVIFEAFRQADGTTNRTYGGTGLGLSISRDLAHLLGGELSLESAPGRGSTFTLVLPHRLVARPVESEPRRERTLTPPPATPMASMIPRVREPLDPASRSLLLIEDDPAFAAILRDLAREHEFQTIVAETADEGLAQAVDRRPNAIILDIGLPDRSGLSVLDALKHNPATRHIPVHVMSASDHTLAALEMGAAGYAIKPIAREELVRAIERLESKLTQRLRRILIVEDDEAHRDSTSRLLSGPDVETVSVGTARDALAELSRSTFDCMVLELTLPDESAFELLEEMSQKDQYGFPPIVVYTGRFLSREDEQRLRGFSKSIIIKGARSPERLLDEVTLFLHQVEAELPPERQRMLQQARHRDAVFEARRVLVVEDDVRNIFALKSVLEPKGAMVEIARNGKEALAHLENNHEVDLVFMDIMMPEMDGITATREIRKRTKHAKLPIIALTAKAMGDDREACLAAGANDYIAKPFDVDKLLSLARVWMPK